MLDEPLAEHDLGSAFQLPAGARVLGSRALVNIGDDVAVLRFLEEGTDIDEYLRARQSFLCVDRRTLSELGPGETRPSFAELAGEQAARPAALSSDSPLTGPPTLPWLLGRVSEGGRA